MCTRLDHYATLQPGPRGGRASVDSISIEWRCTSFQGQETGVCPLKGGLDGFLCHCTFGL